jgi:hypothetical protein
MRPPRTPRCTRLLQALRSAGLDAGTPFMRGFETWRDGHAGFTAANARVAEILVAFRNEGNGMSAILAPLRDREVTLARSAEREAAERLAEAQLDIVIIAAVVVLAGLGIVLVLMRTVVRPLLSVLGA